MALLTVSSAYDLTDVRLLCGADAGLLNDGEIDRTHHDIREITAIAADIHETETRVVTGASWLRF